MKKKIAFIILFAVLISSLLFVTINANDSPTISVGNVAGAPGAYVEVPVTLQNNPGICAFALTVEYNKELLTLNEVRINSALGGMFNYGERAVWGGMNDSTFSGEILTLCFTVSESAPLEDIEISISYKEGDICNYNEDNVTFKLVSGGIKMACQHENTSIIPEIPATCTEDGYTEGVYCNGCNAYISGHQIIAMHGHAFTNYSSNKDATCTVDGTKSAFCDYGCGEINTVTDEGSATGHTESSWTVTREPTCTETGSRQKTCTVCSTVLEKEKIDAHGHSYTNYKSNGDATCELDGTKTALCDYGCGRSDTVSDVGSAKGHVSSDWIIISNATCTDDGARKRVCTVCDALLVEQTLYSYGHSYTTYTSNGDATCTEDGTKTAICDNGCGKTHTVTDFGSATGHKPSIWMTVKNETCTEDGLKQQICTECKVILGEASINAHGHSFKDYTSNGDAEPGKDGTKTAYCDYGCGESDTIIDVGSALGHISSNWIITKEPTCTENGERQQICTECKEVLVTEEIKATGHSFTEYESNNDATCELDGTKTALCDNGCGEQDTVTDEGSATGHKATEWTVTVQPTCQSEGTQSKFCASCGELLEEEALAIVGHSFTNYVSNGDATCQKMGTKTALCDFGCGESDTVDDFELGFGHTPSEWIVDREPTCTEEGSRHKTCTVCQKEIESEAIAVVEHVYTVYTSNGDATCKADGTKTALCDFGCGEKNTVADEGSKKPHTPSVWLVKVEATCLLGGVEYRACEICGELIDERDTEKVAHSFTEYHSNGDATCSKAGTKTASCDYGCGETSTVKDEENMPEHKVISRVTKEPTKEEDGQEIKYCTVCGSTLEIITIPKLSGGEDFSAAVAKLSTAKDRAELLAIITEALEAYGNISDKDSVKDEYNELVRYINEYNAESELVNSEHKEANNIAVTIFSSAIRIFSLIANAWFTLVKIIGGKV